MRYCPSRVALLAATVLAGSATFAQQGERHERIGSHPNLNGIWQAVNTAHWNLEGQSAEAIENYWQLGATFAIPAGQSVVEGGTIPYLPGALDQRARNRADWPASDPEAACYKPGIPRATYMPYPFEIIQGDGDILFVYEFATSNRTVRMDPDDHIPADEVAVDQWMGWSNGRWEGDTLTVEVVGLDNRTWLDRAGNYHNGMKVTEKYTPIDDSHLQYEATIEDPRTFSRPWTISMPLYRRIESNAEILEYKCIEFSEPLLYGEHLKDPIK